MSPRWDNIAHQVLSILISSPVNMSSPERTIVPKGSVIPSHQGPPIFMVPGFFGWALNCQPTALCLCQDTRLYPEAVSLARTSRTLALGGVVGEVTIFAPQLMKLYLCYSVAAAFLCKVYLGIFTACLMVTMANLGVLQYMMRSCSTTLWHATHSTTYFNHHIHTIRHEHSASHSNPTILKLFHKTKLRHKTTNKSHFFLFFRGKFLSLKLDVPSSKAWRQLHDVPIPVVDSHRSIPCFFSSVRMSRYLWPFGHPWSDNKRRPRQDVSFGGYMSIW